MTACFYSLVIISAQSWATSWCWALFASKHLKQPLYIDLFSAGKRTTTGIIQWMKRRTGAGAEALESADSAAQFIDAHNITVVGFFEVCPSVEANIKSCNHLWVLVTPCSRPLLQSLDSEAAQVFKEVAMDTPDTEFGVTATPEVFQKYEVKGSSVVLFKTVQILCRYFALLPSSVRRWWLRVPVNYLSYWPWREKTSEKETVTESTSLSLWVISLNNFTIKQILMNQWEYDKIVVIIFVFI